MHIFVFSLFRSSSRMITSQPTCMVKRQERVLYNTHTIILKSFWRGQIMDGQSSIVDGLKLHRPSTFLKGQFPHFVSTADEIHLSIYWLWYHSLQRFLYQRFGASILWLVVLPGGCTVISVTLCYIYTRWEHFCYKCPSYSNYQSPKCFTLIYW